jgi:YegS/Rv2252/BmrU family lipid kinase
MPSPLPPDPHFRVIVNPQAGRGQGAKWLSCIRDLLQGLRHDLVQTQGPRHATTLARAAAAEGCDVVVAAGGDGTVFETINGLVGSPCALGVLPIGSGNDFVKPLGIPRDLEGAVARLRTGQLRRIDLGRLGDIYFGNGLGIGFDAQAAMETRAVPHLRGLAMYLVAIVRTACRFRAPTLKVCFDGEQVQGRYLMATVANGRCLAANFWLTPQAEMDDGLLDLCLIRAMPLALFFYHLPKVMRGKHTHLRQVQISRARHVQVEADRPVPIHADGEILATGATVLEAEIMPGALQIVC